MGAMGPTWFLHQASPSVRSSEQLLCCTRDFAELRAAQVVALIVGLVAKRVAVDAR